ncbi:MAG: glycosyltransferase family 9 protein [Bacteroidota bacterium]|nr:glycosyltransferase family 9 protein [Bacteroidota bacterium]
MQKSLKILLIRFSSIGDIILTTPVIRCLKKQLDVELHYVTKEIYTSILLNNPYLDKIHALNNDINKTISSLKKENFDYVIDLHNSIRSKFIVLKLGVKSKRYFKSNFNKFILIKFGINILDDLHVVDRYMKTISFLGVKNDNKGLEYFLSSDINLKFNIKQKFITWSIGASYINKQVPLNTILEVCDNIAEPIILLGGEGDTEFGEQVKKRSSKQNIFNFCGELSLSESAYLVKNSCLFLTNDSGLMHIGAAFKKRMISFWGCTKPSLGFIPYQNKRNSVLILANDSNRPCSKHGSKCRETKQICINNISAQEIIAAYNKLIFSK